MSQHLYVSSEQNTTTAQLNHPSIVTIYDTTGDEEMEAIIMEQSRA